jgi:hypothetical protein
VPGAGAQPVDQPALLADLGTTRWAASVGGGGADVGGVVDQRRVGLVTDAVTTGVRQAETARTRPSSEKGSRSSTDPPPRASTMTSTSGSRSSRCRPSITDAAACTP